MLYNFLNHIEKGTGIHIYLSFFCTNFSNIFEAIGMVFDFSLMLILLFYAPGLYLQV